MRTTFLFLVILIIECFTGCVNPLLRRNTAQQSQVISDVYQQQVLNNLARFVYDPGSMPYFSYATQSTNQVQNTAQGNLSGALTGSPLKFTNLGFGVQGVHLANEAFTLTPVNDPRKLELMRCAYQKAAESCRGTDVSVTCPDCKSLLNAFYTGDKDGDIGLKSKGRITTECFNGACWYHVGCKKCLPKNCDCLLVGEYCGLCVWVDQFGRDELTKLTLTILDFAMNSPPALNTKQVVYYIDQNGLPTTQAQAVATVAANIGIDERPESLIHLDTAVERDLEQKLISQVELVDREIRRVRELPEADKREEIKQELRSLLAQRQVLQAKLEFLKRQLDAGALKNPYVLRESTVAPLPILQLQQQLQNIAPPLAPSMQQP